MPNTSHAAYWSDPSYSSSEEEENCYRQPEKISVTQPCKVPSEAHYLPDVADEVVLYDMFGSYRSVHHVLSTCYMTCARL
jgi:hypothetical protein